MEKENNVNKQEMTTELPMDMKKNKKNKETNVVTFAYNRTR